MCRSITRKDEMFRRLLAGEFGNTARTWRSFDEYCRSGYEGLVGIRDFSPSGRTRYYLDRNTMAAEMPMYTPGQYVISQMTPDDKLLLQGEYQYVDGQHCLYFSRHQKPMKIALAHDGQQVTGIVARQLLRWAMWPSSFEDFLALCDLYPYSAIEFSCFDVEIGSVPGRNTIIWEVRDY